MHEEHAENEMRELSEADLELISGAGVVGDALEGILRTVTGWAGGESTLQTGVTDGLRG